MNHNADCAENCTLPLSAHVDQELGISFLDNQREEGTPLGKESLKREVSDVHTCDHAHMLLIAGFL